MNPIFPLLNKLKLAVGHYRKVTIDDPLRMEPVSRLFGLDRGQPVDRYYIERFLSANRASIKGHLLEVADDRYSRQFADPCSTAAFNVLHPAGTSEPGTLRGDHTSFQTLHPAGTSEPGTLRGDHTSFQTLHPAGNSEPETLRGDHASFNTLHPAGNSEPGTLRGDHTSFQTLHPAGTSEPGTLRGDLTIPATLPEARFDCFICTQTYNFIYEVQKAVEGSYRLLKPGGVLLATVAGISQISAYDRDRWGDYWRFTPQSAARLFAQVFGQTNTAITVFGNFAAARALLDGLSTADLPDATILDHHDPEYPVIIGIVATKHG